ncbi:MAG: hypothetical protein A2W93_06940 [Bacteroidetes bacterium GWF2_43_63]|nr:MAG: hypothetical protein A2W94_09940 [Bacteroidetes bacterium GWE2_42_42]OFY53750.1 MAG: hypothetical protein A2W93_06940 [Bacteroidetes bacterium GWF2_43_63]HCB61031.1 hypothetical protein [Bacteroidales bacterium]HCY24153.1 hypothetical protein [Bacteroidales bacterium]
MFSESAKVKSSNAVMAVKSFFPDAVLSGRVNSFFILEAIWVIQIKTSEFLTKSTGTESPDITD